MIWWSTILLGSYPVRGSGSVYPSPQVLVDQRRDLDVSNLCRPGPEEKDEEDVLRVPCMAREITREME